MTERKMMKLSD